MTEITDGTAKFRVINKQLLAILDLIYPVGRIIISNSAIPPWSDIGFGTWQEVAKGAFVEGCDISHTAGDSIDAGLPNITGQIGKVWGNVWTLPTNIDYAGAFKPGELVDNQGIPSQAAQSGKVATHDEFNASWSNPIYGKSETVQPKAYVSHYWLRVK